MNKTARLLLLLLMTMALHVTLTARNAVDGQQREKFLAEMRNYKHAFLIKELALEREQQTRFFTLYDEMEDKMRKINDDTRALEKKTVGDATATDLECENAARALFEQKAREAEVESEYFDKLRDVITGRQLLLLKGAERKFNQELLRYHGKAKGGKR